MGDAHQQPQACDDRLQMHKGAKPGWRVAVKEVGSNQECPHQHADMPSMMWQQATKGRFKQVLNQIRMSRNVTGVFKFVLAHKCLV